MEIDTESQKKALENLATIRKTIDRSYQSDILVAFFGAMSLLFIVGGIVVMLLSGVTWYMISRGLIDQKGIIVLGVMWGVAITVLGLFKMRTFQKQSLESGVSLFKYLRKILGGSFLGLDLPLEISSVIVMIFFIKLHLYVYIPAVIAVWVGQLFAVMGSVFVNRHFTTAGYFYIVLGAFGLFMVNASNVLFYIGLTFGFGMMIIGLAMKFLGNRESRNGKKD